MIPALLAALVLATGQNVGGDTYRTQIGPDSGPTIVLWVGRNTGTRVLLLPYGLTENEGGGR